MADAPSNRRGWSAARRHLATWNRQALLALVRDLYEVAAVNRDFIHARCQAGERSGDVLEVYRGKIVEQFFPTRGYGKLKLGEARKAIRDYRKAAGDVAGVAELLMTYVENGAQFTREFGDIDERLYDSVDAVLTELATYLRGEWAISAVLWTAREVGDDGQRHRLGIWRFRRRCRSGTGCGTSAIVTGMAWRSPTKGRGPAR